MMSVPHPCPSTRVDFLPVAVPVLLLVWGVCAGHGGVVRAADPLAAQGEERNSGPAECRFHYAPAQPGDVGRQSLQVALELERKLSQGGTEIGKDDLHLRRHQQRQITVTEVRGPCATRVRVTFPMARQSLDQPGKPRSEQTQPVEGKTYDVARVGQELVIRDNDGGEPAEDEREIVATAMAALGRPSPLGELLHNKTLQVGQHLVVPTDMIRDFLGMQADAASTVRMQLEAVRGPTQRPIALFRATMQLPPTPAGEFGLHVSGQWEVDASTCQTVAATFRGPVQSLETRGPAGAQYLISTQGNIELRLVRAHDEVTR